MITPWNTKNVALRRRLNEFVQHYGDAAGDYLDTAYQGWYGTDDERRAFVRICKRQKPLLDAWSIVFDVGPDVAPLVSQLVRAYLGRGNVDAFV